VTALLFVIIHALTKAWKPEPRLSKMELDIPSDLTPSLQGEHLAISYDLQIELIVESFFATNLKTSVPLTILGPDEKVRALTAVLIRTRLMTYLTQISEMLIFGCVVRRDPKPDQVLLSEKEVHNVKVWMPDSLSYRCSACDKKFGLLTRSHNCRCCGRIVCSDCGRKTYLPELGAIRQRVCSYCLRTALQMPSTEASEEADGFVTVAL